MSVAPRPEAPPEGSTGWQHKLGSMIFILFCFEVGIFLLVFPWLDPWDNNWMADFIVRALPGSAAVWSNPFFRGALSGLGVINIYISLVEIFRLRKLTG